jgi:hypothetical protein
VRPASSKPTRPRSAGPLDALSPRRGVAYGRCRHRPRDSGKCSRVNAPACHLQDRAPAGQWQRSGRVRVWNPAACRPRNKRSGTPNTSPSDQLTLPSRTRLVVRGVRPRRVSGLGCRRPERVRNHLQSRFRWHQHIANSFARPNHPTRLLDITTEMRALAVAEDCELRLPPCGPVDFRGGVAGVDDDVWRLAVRIARRDKLDRVGITMAVRGRRVTGRVAGSGRVWFEAGRLWRWPRSFCVMSARR